MHTITQSKEEPVIIRQSADGIIDLAQEEADANGKPIRGHYISIERQSIPDLIRILNEIWGGK